ncbi:hypothetical protein ACFL6O_03660 [candidate division KSB1 bacterium]
MEPVITSPDILPIPAPYWLILSLLIFTFVIHLVFMNCLLGGTFISAYNSIFGKNDPKKTHLSKKLFGFMPAVIAVAVNFGVAPLLFVQTLYGHLLYSSSILMAFFWFSIIPLAIFGYYGSYLLKFKWEEVNQKRILVTGVVSLIFMVVAFFFVNNMTLMLRPEQWFEHYFKAPATGTLNWWDIQIYPRYLHVFFGALAVTGVWIMIIGSRGLTGDREWSEWAVKYGSKIFFITTLINIVIGFLFLFANPKHIWMIFMGQNMTATILFVLSLVLVISALLIIKKAGNDPANKKLTWNGAGHLLMILIFMIIMRHQLRDAYLEPYFNIKQLESAPQWDVFILFAVILVIGFGALGWMMKVVLNMKKPEEV